jgi:hypothetical protein
MNKKKLNFLKKMDIYGYPIPINFKKHEHSFKTKIGGIFTILTFFIVTVQFILCIYKMVRHGQDINKIIISKLNP